MPAVTRIFIIHIMFHVTLGFFPGLDRHLTRPPTCLLGDMTDVQNWVDEHGKLIVDDGGHTNTSIDLSYDHRNPAYKLQKIMGSRDKGGPVKYLSMAMCSLRAVPMIFRLEDSKGRKLCDTLEAISFYGNKFDNFGPAGSRYGITMNATYPKEVYKNKDVLSAETTWNIGFRRLDFKRLKELDLRWCSIQFLNDYFLGNMTELKALYLSGNNIYHIHSRAFSLLPNLVHLDLSRNTVHDEKGNERAITWSSTTIFFSIPLRSLDLSFTLMSENGAPVLFSLESQLQRLSLCYTGIKNLRPATIANTALKYLDVSGNNGILRDKYALTGLEDTLEVVYADGVGMRSLAQFANFTKLKILKLSNNELTAVQQSEAKSLKNLEILDLSYNRISSWFSPTFSLFENLQVLSLGENNINIINPEIINDVQNISYIGLRDNFFVCTCYAREFLDIAANNEQKLKHKQMSFFNYHTSNKRAKKDSNTFWDFHTGFTDYFDQVSNRNIVSLKCDSKNSTKSCQRNESDLIMEGNFLLFDYSYEQYKCLVVEDGKLKSFSEINFCNHRSESIYGDVIYEGWKKIFLIIVMGCVVLPCLAIGFFCRRRFMYFCVTVKNSALLSSISQAEGYSDGSIFHYDVFVSYCNEDRPWVLDHLLPHVERDCNVSVCLHERDFQVGLSILENIVSCMDRSRTIMLVISHRFLLSQWCQFEMHLAQHRLLETRREDLILVLLEDIPRHMRPNTLHYLMRTKTYVLWPKSEGEKTVFWRRLKKSLVTNKLKNTDNHSLV